MKELQKIRIKDIQKLLKFDYDRHALIRIDTELLGLYQLLGKLKGGKKD